MEIQFSSPLNPSLLRRLLCRRLLPWVITCLSSVALCLVGAATQNSWADPVAVAGVTFASFMMLILVTRVGKAFSKLNRFLMYQGAEPLQYRVDEKSLHTTDRLGTIELPWTSFTRLDEHPGYILFRAQNGGAFTLPTENVPKEALHLIREQFSSKEEIL